MYNYYIQIHGAISTTVPTKLKIYSDVSDYPVLNDMFQYLLKCYVITINILHMKSFVCNKIHCGYQSMSLPNNIPHTLKAHVVG